MFDLATLTVSQLLGIPETVPEKLFSAPGQVEAEFRKLAKRMHPDLGGDNDALVRLNKLHALAKAKIERGEWLTPGKIEFSGTDGKTYRIGYVKDFDLGIGRAYIGNTFVAYVLNKDTNDLVENGLAVIKTFLSDKSFPDTNIQKQMTMQLPKLKKTFHTTDHVVVVIEKPAAAIRLKDVVEHYKGKFEPKHAAWTLSRLFGVTTYLSWAGLSHNDISMDTVFIHPGDHTIHLLGGWWHTVKIGAKMARLQSSRTLAYAPQSVLTSKIASAKTDLELVRLTGREILGDSTGLMLAKDKAIPAAMTSWLRHTTAGDAKADYTKWYEVLKTSYGERRFTVLDLNPSDIYKE